MDPLSKTELTVVEDESSVDYSSTLPNVTSSHNAAVTVHNHHILQNNTHQTDQYSSSVQPVALPIERSASRYLKLKLSLKPRVARCPDE